MNDHENKMLILALKLVLDAVELDLLDTAKNILKELIKNYEKSNNSD